MALTWSDAVGPAGAVLVIALGAMALVLVLWVMRGAGGNLACSPERGAAEAAVQSTKRHLWLEALTEPALISDRGARPLRLTPAILIAQLAHVSGDSAHAPSVDPAVFLQSGHGCAGLSLVEGREARRRETECCPPCSSATATPPSSSKSASRRWARHERYGACAAWKRVPIRRVQALSIPRALC